MIRRVWLLARKDLRTLLRSRLMVLTFLAYPLVIAALLGFLVLSASQSAAIGLVNHDEGANEITIGDETFSIEQFVRQAAEKVDVVEYDDEDAALEAMDDGQVVGVLVIPKGSVRRLEDLVEPAVVRFHTADSEVGDIVMQRLRGSVYTLNLRFSRASLEVNVDYIQKLAEGGTVSFQENEYELLGLEQSVEVMEEALEHVDDEDVREDIEEVIEFAQDAQLAISVADDTLETASAPVRLEHVRSEGASPVFTARGLSFLLAVTISFVCTILVAASTAGERDEHVLGRLLRGVVGPWQVLAGKLVMGAALAVGMSASLFVLFAILAPQAWLRLPLLLVCVAMASAAFSALGTLLATLTRDARTATLVGILIVLPLAPMGLLSGFSVARSISSLLPFTPAQRLFNAVLFEPSPWQDMAVGLTHLGVMTLLLLVASVRLLPRLVR